MDDFEIKNQSNQILPIKLIQLAKRQAAYYLLHPNFIKTHNKSSCKNSDYRLLFREIVKTKNNEIEYIVVDFIHIETCCYLKTFVVYD